MLQTADQRVVQVGQGIGGAVNVGGGCGSGDEHIGVQPVIAAVRAQLKGKGNAVAAVTGDQLVHVPLIGHCRFTGIIQAVTLIMIVQPHPVVRQSHGDPPGGAGEGGVDAPLAGPGAEGLQRDLAQKIKPDTGGTQSGLPYRFGDHRGGVRAGQGFAQQNAHAVIQFVGLGGVVLDGVAVHPVAYRDTDRAGGGGELHGVAGVGGLHSALRAEEGDQPAQQSLGAGDPVLYQGKAGQIDGGQGEQHDEQGLESLHSPVSAASRFTPFHGEAPPSAG